MWNIEQVHYNNLFNIEILFLVLYTIVKNINTIKFSCIQKSGMALEN